MRREDAQTLNIECSLRSIMAEITPVNIHRGLYLVENTTGIEFIFIIGIDITITVQ